MDWKSAARVCLHSFGGLKVFRRIRRREFRVLMFHTFHAANEANVKAICSHVARHFEPVSLSDIISAAEQGRSLPDDAVTVTVDDGYRQYLDYAHLHFRRERIPVTVYAVSGFADGRLWLWTDIVDYCLTNANTRSIRPRIDGLRSMELKCGADPEARQSIFMLTEALKTVPHHVLLEFLAKLGPMCGVDVAPQPPPQLRAMTWEELRAIAGEGVEIGCHTATHPILSRIDSSQRESEIRGAKQFMEERLGFAVRHFCYPNGREADIGAETVRAVRAAGFRSGVTTIPGLNTLAADPMWLRRLPTADDEKPGYIFELLAGLHLPKQSEKRRAAIAA